MNGPRKTLTRSFHGIIVWVRELVLLENIISQNALSWHEGANFNGIYWCVHSRGVYGHLIANPLPTSNLPRAEFVQKLRWNSYSDLNKESCSALRLSRLGPGDCETHKTLNDANRHCRDAGTG